MAHLADIEIARNAKLKNIKEVASINGIPEDNLELYGNYKAKISFDYVSKMIQNPKGKLVLV